MRAEVLDEYAGLSAVKLENLSFRYRNGTDEYGPKVLENISFEIPRGSRCLVVGGNGAGKSTLLRIMGGMHMISPADSCTVLARDSFGDRRLNVIRTLLQTEWATRSVAFAGYNVPLQGDFPVKEMNSDWQEMFPKRRQELIDLLQMDLDWRMNRVSDGQRRRVQLFLHMLRPFEVLLLDEVLSVLDVVVRNDLLQYLKKECVERNATVIYATHIFDGLMDWPTHLIYVKNGGKIGYAGPFGPQYLPELKELLDRHEPSPLLKLVDTWLRREALASRIKEAEAGDLARIESNDLLNAQNRGGGYTSGRLYNLLDKQ